MALIVDIEKTLGDFHLKVNFTAEREVMALLGASGCGKSMTLGCIAGIVRPDKGHIELNGRVLFDSDKKINLPPQKRKVGYLFQQYALFPQMTVEQNIRAGAHARPKAEREQAVREVLHAFRLEGLENNRPSQLSGGQQQRCALARILVGQPELVLLDEPFSALDAYLKWQVELELSDILKNLSCGTLFVTHNRDEVYRLCDTVSCMNRGKMEVMEPLKEFFQNPKTRTAAILSGCKNISAAERVDAHTLRAVDWGVTLHVKEREIADDIRAVGIRAHFLATVERPGEENVFPVNESEIWEDPFEWNISFRKNAECSWLQWNIAKTDWSPEMGIPKELYLKEEDILLLTDS